MKEPTFPYHQDTFDFHISAYQSYDVIVIYTESLTLNPVQVFYSNEE